MSAGMSRYIIAVIRASTTISPAAHRKNDFPSVLVRLYVSSFIRIYRILLKAVYRAPADSYQ